MIEECGRVVATGADGAWVETLARAGCGRCDQPGGCGQNSITRLFASRNRRVRVAAPIPVETGDRVLIGIPEGQLLRASLVVYLLPLLGLVFGSVTGHLVSAASEAMAILGAALGMTGGFLVSHLLSRMLNGRDSWLPVVIARLPQDDPGAVVVDPAAAGVSRRGESL